MARMVAVTIILRIWPPDISIILINIETLGLFVNPGMIKKIAMTALNSYSPADE